MDQSWQAGPELCLEYMRDVVKKSTSTKSLHHREVGKLDLVT